MTEIDSRAGRRVVNLHTTPFQEYDLEGPTQPELSWLLGMEEFLIVDGSLVDDDGAVFQAGDFVSYDADTHHNSRTETGCTMAVFEWRRPGLGS